MEADSVAHEIAERLVWAVNTLEIEPSDRLLEIGCGHGAAVSLICGQLTDGTITALDRSETMIRAAASRNLGHASAGKARFHTAELDKTNWGPERFNKIFAVNVNLFWMKPAKELNIIRTLLLPGGSVYLFNQPPTAGKIVHIADRTTQNLTAEGFIINQILNENLSAGPAVCVIAGIP
jgi:trans-aconitate methyltransferase